MAPFQPELRLTVGSRYEEIDLIEQVGGALLAHLGFAEPAREKILLAVREAVANAVQHGNGLDLEKPVEVGFGVEDGDLIVRVRDRGEGFDPDVLPDPLAPQNLLKPRGRGIFLMRSFMDRVDFHFPDRSGTVVELRARVAAEVKAAEGEPAMKIEKRQEQGVTILEPKGKITIGKGDIALRDAIHEALKAGARNLLIDLASVSRVDSSGVAELVAAHTTVTNLGGELKLLNLGRRVRNVLGTTQIITVFDVFEDEQEALASFE